MHPSLIQISLEELEAEAENVEQIIDQTPEIDPWCSSPDWVLSTHSAFSSTTEPLILSDPSRSGYALLSRYTNEAGNAVIAGLEPMWGFASPVVATDPEAFGAMLAATLNERDDWDLLGLPGLPTPKSQQSFTVELLRSLSSLGEAQVGAGIGRQVADISAAAGGFEGWLSRRSTKFRRNLRRTKAAAADAGVSIVDASEDPEAFPRILRIESASWKGLEESGITAPEMQSLYRTLCDRLARKGRLELYIAQQAERDIGFILGGRRSGLYRGLQLSYSQDASELSVGHLLQLHQIEQLTLNSDSTGASVGGAAAFRYDLGMDIDYKQRWADHLETSIVLVLQRKRERENP